MEEKHLAGQHDQRRHTTKTGKKNSWVMALPAKTPAARKLRKELALKYGKRKLLLGAEQRSIARKLSKANALVVHAVESAKRTGGGMGDYLLRTIASNPELQRDIARLVVGGTVYGAKKVGSAASSARESIAYPYGRTEPVWERQGRQQSAAEYIARGFKKSSVDELTK